MICLPKSKRKDALVSPHNIILNQESVGLVDGNVIRVVSRLRKIGADSTSKSSTEAYWRNADDLVDPSRPGDFNQALMELGAIVCTPKNPSCSKCPLKANCQAYSEVTARSAGGDGKQVTASDSIDDIENVPTCNLCIPKTDKYQQELGVTNYPRKGKKAEQRIQKSLVVIIRFGDKYLLTQRPETGLLANLMEFPSLKDLNQEEDCSVKEVKALIGKKTSLVNFEVNRQGEVIHQVWSLTQKNLVGFLISRIMVKIVRILQTHGISCWNPLLYSASLHATLNRDPVSQQSKINLI